MTVPDVVLTDTAAHVDQQGRGIAPGRYIWRGPPSSPVFALLNCRDMVSEQVEVICETPCSAVVQIERTSADPSIVTSTNNGFRRWRILGNGRAQIGFLCRGIDENNEHMRFDDCSVYGCKTGWEFQGQQSKEHLLTHCRFESGIIAVQADSGFQWIGGACAQCDIGIHLSRVGEPVKIQGVGFESTGCVLITDGPTTDAQPIVLDSVRFAADQLHADGAMIFMRHAGPLVIIGGSYGDGHQRVPHIQLAGIGEQAVSIVGAKFGAFGAADVPLIVANPGVQPSTGSAYQRVASESDRTVIRALPLCINL